MGNHYSGASKESDGNNSVTPRNKIKLPFNHHSQNVGAEVVNKRLVELFEYLCSGDEHTNDQAEIPKERFVQYFACSFKCFGEVLWKHYVYGVQKSDSHRYLINNKLSGSVNGLNVKQMGLSNSARCKSIEELSENKKNDETVVNSLERNKFLLTSQDICGLHTDSQRISYFLHVFSHGSETICKADLELLVHSCYVLGSWSAGYFHPLNINSCMPYVKAVVNSVMGKGNYVTVELMANWMKKNCPNMISSMFKWINGRLITVANSIDDIGRSLVDDSEEYGRDLMHPMVEWLLTCSLPQLYIQPPKNVPSVKHVLSGHISSHDFLAKMLSSVRPLHWTTLYQSDENGLSINRLKHHVFSYRGPTLMLVSGEDGQLVCVAVDQEWREGISWWGDKNSISLQITPEFKKMSSGPGIFYMNLGQRGHPFGLHVGANHKSPDVQIDKELNILYVKKAAFKMVKIEVWGCACEEAKAAQANQKKWEDQQAEGLRKIKVDPNEWRDTPDRFLLDLVSKPGSKEYTEYNKKQ